LGNVRDRRNNKAEIAICLLAAPVAGPPKKKKMALTTHTQDRQAEDPSEVNRLELDRLESVLPEGAAGRGGGRGEVSDCMRDCHRARATPATYK
jgi:hypothetical protein